jgi:hypothetical protein
VSKEEVSENWLGQPPEQQAPDTHTRLNYVIPAQMEHLLTRYCVQTEMKPGPLVRRLITDFVKGEVGVNAEVLVHPHGRRTSVDLPARLLAAFEARCDQVKAPTKAALIAGLLGDFLPTRIDSDTVERITVGVPSVVFSKIYAQYGPGPSDEVIVTALCDLIQKNQSRAIPAPQEA